MFNDEIRTYCINNQLHKLNKIIANIPLNSKRPENILEAISESGQKRSFVKHLLGIDSAYLNTEYNWFNNTATFNEYSKNPTIIFKFIAMGSGGNLNKVCFDSKFTMKIVKNDNGDVLLDTSSINFLNICNNADKVNELIEHSINEYYEEYVDATPIKYNDRKVISFSDVEHMIFNILLDIISKSDDYLFLI